MQFSLNNVTCVKYIKIQIINDFIIKLSIKKSNCVNVKKSFKCLYLIYIQNNNRLLISDVTESTLNPNDSILILASY